MGNFFFNRIDRYIAGLFLLYFAAGLIVFITVFTAIDALTTMVTYKDVAATSLLQYYGFSLPETIYRMAPVSCLLATVFTLSTLGRNSELVALYSVGMSLMRITFPILLLVTLVAGGVFLVGDRVMPGFAKSKNFIFYNEIKKNPSLYSIVKNEKIWYRSKDTIFNIKSLNDNTHEAQGLTLYYFNDQWELIQMMSAKKVKLSGKNWELQDGSVTLFTEDSSFPLTSPFQKKTIVMTEDAKDLSSTAQTANILSQKELSSFIKKNKEAGLDTVLYEVDYHSKFGFAFAAIVMTLVGIPFSVAKGRSGGIMVNVGICFGLILVYWIFYSSSLTLGQHGHLHPVVAAWLPNFVMASLAIYYLSKK